MSSSEEIHIELPPGSSCWMRRAILPLLNGGSVADLWFDFLIYLLYLNPDSIAFQRYLEVKSDRVAAAFALLG